MDAAREMNIRPLSEKKEKFFNRRTTPFYLMILPALLLTLIFKYVTMPGRLIAFLDWRTTGLRGWVGLTHFEKLFSLHNFWSAFLNQWVLILYGYIFVFPAPIFLALLLNEVRSQGYKKFVQTLTVIPHFINWVVIGGIFIKILSPNYGIVNDIIVALGGKPVFFMSIPEIFPAMFTGMRMWKGVGYSTIVYLATLSSIDPQLYEAAVIDGASRWKQTLHITIPGLKSVILVLFVLSFAHVMTGFFEPILVLKNPMIESTADILDTYIYRVGLIRGKYGLGAAAGFFKAIISMTLLLAANFVSKRVTEDGKGIL